MDINRHIGIRKDKNPELFSYLDANSILYENVLGTGVFDILESDPHWETVSALMGQSQSLCLCNTIYTQEELEAAHWLTLRSVWRYGYPQPEDGVGYEAITYSLPDCCPICRAGLKQSADFRIKKTPNWGKRHAMMLNWVGDELFVDDIAKNLLSKSDLSGFRFRDVRNKKGTEIHPNVNQLVVLSLLPRGIDTNNRSIDQTYICSRCGTIKYHPTGIGSFRFRQEIFENAPDIIKSEEIFGWEYWTQRLIIVSQRFYQEIIKNHLGSDLEFKPIDLI